MEDLSNGLKGVAISKSYTNKCNFGIAGDYQTGKSLAIGRSSNTITLTTGKILEYAGVLTKDDLALMEEMRTSEVDLYSLYCFREFRSFKNKEKKLYTRNYSTVFVIEISC